MIINILLRIPRNVTCDYLFNAVIIQHPLQKDRLAVRFEIYLSAGISLLHPRNSKTKL